MLASWTWISLPCFRRAADKNQICLLCTPACHARELSSLVSSQRARRSTTKYVVREDYKDDCSSGSSLYVLFSVCSRQIFCTNISFEHPSSIISQVTTVGTSLVVFCFSVEDAILAIHSRCHLSSCSLFSYGCRGWLSLGKGAVLKQTILSTTIYENLSLRNQSPKFRSINLEMQCTCQSFYAKLPFNRFCILTFSLRWGFLLVFNLSKIFLMFCYLGEYDSNAYFRCTS